MAPKIYSKKCGKCGKEIASLVESQFKYNYGEHMKAHKKEEERNEIKKEEKK